MLQEELAPKSRCSVTGLWQVESGKWNSVLLLIGRIARALGVSICSLFESRR